VIQKLLDPFWQIWANPAHQLHPQVIHFAIVFLVLEAVTLIIFVIRKQPQVAALSLIFLHCAFWTMLLAVLTGLNDVGLDLGAGNRIMLGFRDRWENAFRAQSSVTIHVWLALILIALTSTRLVWRSLGRDRVLNGIRGATFAVLTLLNFWTLLAATYVGASITHK
jgi:uncharacterized membrane protein